MSRQASLQGQGKVRFKAQTGKRLQVFPRATVAGQVIIHDETSLYIAPLLNMSAGGIFIEKLNAIESGKLVRLVLKCPRIDRVIQATGTIVRIEKGGRLGSAVEFTAISSEAREAIQTCVYEAKMETALKLA